MLTIDTAVRLVNAFLASPRPDYPDVDLAALTALLQRLGRLDVAGYLEVARRSGLAVAGNPSSAINAGTALRLAIARARGLVVARYDRQEKTGRDGGPEAAA
jgi:hypothetical protein